VTLFVDRSEGLLPLEGSYAGEIVVAEPNGLSRAVGSGAICRPERRLPSALFDDARPASWPLAAPVAVADGVEHASRPPISAPPPSPRRTVGVGEAGPKEGGQPWIMATDG
jgi:hypothetical protein